MIDESIFSEKELAKIRHNRDMYLENLSRFWLDRGSLMEAHATELNVGISQRTMNIIVNIGSLGANPHPITVKRMMEFQKHNILNMRGAGRTTLMEVCAYQQAVECLMDNVHSDGKVIVNVVLSRTVLFNSGQEADEFIQRQRRTIEVDGEIFDVKCIKTPLKEERCPQ